MSKESTEIYQKSTIDHYINRPDSFQEMCLAEFVGNYDYYTNEKYKRRNEKIGYYYNEDDRDDDLLEEMLKADQNISSDEEMEPFESDEDTIINKNQKDNSSETTKFIKLKNNDGYVKKREATKYFAIDAMRCLKISRNIFANN